MSPRVKSSLLLCAVFLLGGITGGALATARTASRMQDSYERPPNVLRQQRVLRALKRQVDLDAGQVEAIASIMAKQDRELRALRREPDPRAVELRGRLVEELRGVMRSDQLPGFERFVERAEARRKRRGLHSPDGPR